MQRRKNLRARVVVTTSSLAVSRRLTDYVKEMCLNACLTCSTVIFLFSTNHIIARLLLKFYIRLMKQITWMHSCDSSLAFNGWICRARYLVPRVCEPFCQRVSTHRDSNTIEAIFSGNVGFQSHA